MKKAITTALSIFLFLKVSAQCTLVIDSVHTSNVSCNGASDGSITVFVSGNNGVVSYSNGTSGEAIVPKIQFNNSAELSTASGSGPTDRWWSPSSCNSGVYFQYSSSQGCPAGSAQFSGGFSGFAGCFLRSPKINMNGVDQVSISMDITNSYNASRPNDNLRFYVWVNNAYLSTASKFTVNGLSGNSLKFTQERSCEEVTVTVDLSGIASGNRNDFMFYIEANCGYNNCSAYQVVVDNINISQGAAFQREQTFYGLAPGAYPITVKDVSGCSVTLPEPLIITEPELVKPEITMEGTTLKTGDYLQYQWFLEGDSLQAANEQEITFQANGNYTVSVVDSNGCAGTSEPFQVLTTGIKQEHQSDLRITPNPFSDRVSLVFRNETLRNIEVRSLTGELLIHKDCYTNAVELYTEGLSPGVYIVRVGTAKDVQSMTIIKIAK